MNLPLFGIRCGASISLEFSKKLRLEFVKSRGAFRPCERLGAQALIDVAHIAMQINLAKESKQLERGVQREISELVA